MVPPPTDRRVVPARAALAAVVHTARNSDEAQSDSFFSGETWTCAAKVGLLPPGVPAPAIGRGALIPGQPAWAESGLGAPQDVPFRTPAWAYQILFWAGRERAVVKEHEIPGPIDIPVWADPDTGEIVAVDEEGLVAELQPLADLGKRIWKEEDAPLAPVRSALRAPKRAGGLFKAIKDQVVDLVDDVKAIGDTGAPPPGPRPGPPDHPPVEGVDYRTWMTVRAGLVRDAVHPTHVEVYAVHRGVPAGRWAAVDAAWQARAGEDATVGAWAAFDQARLEPFGAVWGPEP